MRTCDIHRYHLQRYLFRAKLTAYYLSLQMFNRKIQANFANILVSSATFPRLLLFYIQPQMSLTMDRGRQKVLLIGSLYDMKKEPIAMHIC